MTTKHTPGPWRWEINAKHKSIHLVGGVPLYDLTVMDFERWGMGGAVIRLRDLAHDGMNVMHRVCDRQDWIAPFEGRDHHANWCAALNHADARLIAAAPTMAATLQRAAHVLAEIADQISGDDCQRLDALRSEIIETIKQATPEYYGGAA